VLNLRKYAEGLAKIVSTCLDSQGLNAEERVEVWKYMLEEIAPIKLTDAEAMEWAANTKFPIGPFKDIPVIDAHPGYVTAYRFAKTDEFWSMLVRYCHSSYFKEVHEPTYRNPLE